MKHLRQLCMALALTLTLSATALAEGKMDCPGVTQEPPSVEQTTEQDASCGDMLCGVIEVVTNLFDAVLSLV